MVLEGAAGLVNTCGESKRPRRDVRRPGPDQAERSYLMDAIVGPGVDGTTSVARITRALISRAENIPKDQAVFYSKMSLEGLESLAEGYLRAVSERNLDDADRVTVLLASIAASQLLAARAFRA